MRAKTYLKKIDFYDTVISSNRRKIATYKDTALNKTSNLSPNKVQSSSTMQKMESAVISYSDLEMLVQVLERRRQDIIDDISLLEPFESTVLYKRYVDKSEFYDMVNEMEKSPSWVYKTHSSGIKNLQAILDEREKVG